jgi:hypothetical protein
LFLVKGKVEQAFLESHGDAEDERFTCPIIVLEALVFAVLARLLCDID